MASAVILSITVANSAMPIQKTGASLFTKVVHSPTLKCLINFQQICFTL